MAHHTEQVGFPAIPLTAGMRLRLRALSPTANSAVAGVVFTEWSIYGYDESEPLELEPAPVEWLGLPAEG